VVSKQASKQASRLVGKMAMNASNGVVSSARVSAKP